MLDFAVGKDEDRVDVAPARSRRSASGTTSRTTPRPARRSAAGSPGTTNVVPIRRSGTWARCTGLKNHGRRL